MSKQEYFPFKALGTKAEEEEEEEEEEEKLALFMKRIINFQQMIRFKMYSIAARKSGKKVLGFSQVARVSQILHLSMKRFNLHPLRAHFFLCRLCYRVVTIA